MFRLWLIHDDYSTSTARSVSKFERLQREIVSGVKSDQLGHGQAVRGWY